MLSSTSSLIIIRGRVTVGRRFSYHEQSSVTMRIFHPMGAAATATAMLALATTTTTTTPIGVVHSFATTSSSSCALFPRHTSSAFTAKKTSSVLVRGGTTTAATETKKTPSLVRRSMTATTDALLSSTSTTATMDTMTPAAKLEALRIKMKELNLDVYIIPSDDPHLSEYVPSAYMRRKFLSGFGGSAGTAIVTQDEALLWTDSRYWNEANLEIDSSLWTLMKAGQPKVPKIPNYLGKLAAKHYTANQNKALAVGIDPFVHPASFAKELADAFDEAIKAELTLEAQTTTTGGVESLVEIGKLDTTHANLIDPIWGQSRPEIPYSPFRVHPIEYAGVSVDDKVAKIRKEMETKRATLAVFCTLDDVAYLLNVRAMGDVDTCPVGIAYATISKDEVTLYCDSRKVESPAVQEHLKGVTIKPYDDIVNDIGQHCQADIAHNKIWIDASRANYALVNVIPKKSLIDIQNAVTPMKACKNKAELQGMRQAHIVDGVAYAKFMAIMQERVGDKGESISEVEVDEILTGLRAKQPGFLECSFPTIAGVGSNAAIIHYRAKDDEIMKHWDQSNPILIDSGGQYTYGTTDVTRTWHLGTPTDEFMDYYTRVLKGNIGVDSMIFPENTPGLVLDVYARQHLWQAGKDYGHGTGHGVGAALNVHEGPFSISPRFANLEGLKAGMVVSNEPGYYEDGKLGVRIENLLEISYVKDEYNAEANASEKGEVPSPPPQSSDKKFLKFSKLTMIPIQKNLIKMELMTDTELDWLDAYHAEIMTKVVPLLEADSLAMKWLESSCAKVERTKRS